MHGITRYVERLLRSRRPRRFQASETDADLARAAIALRAARLGSGAPTEEFVTGLHKKLAAELDPPAPHHTVGARRTFLRVATVAGAAAVGAGIGAGADHTLTAAGGAPANGGAPAAAGTAGTLSPDRGTWLTVAASADLPDGTVRAFSANEITGFVQRKAGRLHAVSGVCTHQGCKLALSARPARLVCPCHGAEFALDGAVLNHKLPVSLTALPQLAVREADGAVQVYAPV
jgi:cytochrome b6-f complex iron-sulfur subunit